LLSFLLCRKLLLQFEICDTVRHTESWQTSVCGSVFVQHDKSPQEIDNILIVLSLVTFVRL